MGEDKKPMNKSRRWFLTGGLSEKGKKQMVKMLTPDGKLVEVDQAIVKAATNKVKANNQDIYNWMQNPSKENN
ncbi:MAG: hypothetical protein ACOYLO_19215, partial [Ferruginibacter sp.]